MTTAPRTRTPSETLPPAAMAEVAPPPPPRERAARPRAAPRDLLEAEWDWATAWRRYLIQRAHGRADPGD